MQPTSKYFALYMRLKESQQDELTLPFYEIESLIGGKLSSSARTSRAWWSNRKTGAWQAKAWMEAGYRVETVDFVGEQVTFRKPGVIYTIQKRGDVVAWDGDLIKALREFMGLTQAEMAEELGMRQQTISEWETGAYLPKRSTSKFLTMVAEQAEFVYGSD